MSDDSMFPARWYAVAWSSELKKKPLKKRIAGRDIVLFRGEDNAPHAIHAYCPHRGADLSLGSCADGGIRCPFHGWLFQGNGRCTDIPSQPGARIPEFAHATAYRVMEKAGLIWVYPSNHPHDELTLFPELEDPDLRLVPFQSTWKAHFTRVVESVLDVAHLPVVHRRTIGRKSSLDVKIQFQADGDWIRIENNHTELEYRFPQQWILRPRSRGKHRLINFVTFTPVDSHSTDIRGYIGRNFAKSFLIDKILSQFSLKVLKEDQEIVESQHPRPIPESLRLEAHVAADGPQVRFRNRWYSFLTGKEPKLFSAADHFEY
jgi:phenylpropionate dioxygenase-like ring-hydroxylating dioxygenase large terminal subunit